MKIETISVIIVNRDASRGVLLLIESSELLKSSHPIVKMKNETIRAAMYSMRPCPKGWAASGFFALALNPMIVTIDAALSLKLFNASAITETEWLKSPATSFPANKKRFKPIPTIPHNSPYIFLTARSCVLLQSLIKILQSNVIIQKSISFGAGLLQEDEQGIFLCDVI